MVEETICEKDSFSDQLEFDFDPKALCFNGYFDSKKNCFHFNLDSYQLEIPVNWGPFQFLQNYNTFELIIIRENDPDKLFDVFDAILHKSVSQLQVKSLNSLLYIEIFFHTDYLAAA